MNISIAPEATPSPSPKKLGLSLSGGGYRAAAFHTGVLRRLAEDGLLERVSAISTVSGGSLITAALFAQAAGCWPSSKAYRDEIYPRLKALLTSTDLLSVKALGVSGVVRFNFKILTDRAAILASRLQSEWGVDGSVGDLPSDPLWWINTTCVETGKNWRFAKRHMGDWIFGTNYNPPFKVAQAAAASAAVPYAIGALTLKLPKDGWFQTDPATKQALRQDLPRRTKVRLWDGGAYENLGLEALYKPDGLRDCDILICSDASGPLPIYKWSNPLDLARGRLWSPRLFDVASDQIRSLRSRYLVRDIQTGVVAGALLRLGISARNMDLKTSQLRAPAAYDAYLSDSEVGLAVSEPTGLTRLSADSFERVARNGWEVADATLMNYLPELLPETRAWRAA
jgi:NTE family protein